MPERRKYADRVEYLKMAVAKRRKKVRQMLVEYKGGKCELCGYSGCIDVLDLHHRDPSTKEFGISSSGLTRSWEKNKAEADKCVFALRKLPQRDSRRLQAAYLGNQVVNIG